MGSTSGPSIRRRRVSAAVAAAVLASAIAVAITAGGASAARSGKRDPTVHVIEHAVTDTVVYSGGKAKADKTGNTLTFHNKVFDTADKTQVGTDQGFCMRIDPSAGSWECFWTTLLAKGQITVEGPYYDTKNSVLAITGGTGAYRDASGEMNLLSRNGGKEYDFIFHVDS
jgi:Allene oxide cyclase